MFAAEVAAPLRWVSAAGGPSSPLTTIDASRPQWPWFLPDGRHFLYADFDGPLTGPTIRVGSLDPAEGTNRGSSAAVVGAANSNAVYAQGHVLFLRDTTLMAQPFDATRLVTTGDAVPVVERVRRSLGSWRGMFSVSGGGFLAYQASSEAGLAISFGSTGAVSRVPPSEIPVHSATCISRRIGIMPPSESLTR